jgi:hypothetical protein
VTFFVIKLSRVSTRHQIFALPVRHSFFLPSSDRISFFCE